MAKIDGLFMCSWGDILLFASSIEWESGETQVVHDLAVGDEHPVQPRGSHIKTATAQLMFDDFDGQIETGVDAFRRFEATTKERRIFTHPVSGSYFCRIGDFKPQMDSDSVITASCEFIPDTAVRPVSPAGASTTGISGELAVAAATDKVATALAAAGIGFDPRRLSKLDFSKSVSASIDVAFSVDLSVSASFSASASASASANASASASAVAVASAQAQATASAYAFAGVYAEAIAAAEATAVVEISAMASAEAFAYAYASAAVDADARASAASWAESDVSTRKILIDNARLSDSIAQMIETGGFERDLQLYPSFRSAIMMGDAIRSAAVSATAATSAVFLMRLQTPTALLALAARVYGGAQAQERARQISELNDIRTPGWMDIGDYLMPARSSGGGVSFGAQ